MEPSWFLVLEPKKLISENKFCSNMTPSLRTGPPSHYIVITNGGNYSKIRFEWPWVNACALHFGCSFQGYLTWPYLARSNTLPNTVFGVLGSIYEFPKQGDFFVVHSINWRLRSDKISAFGIYVVAPLCHIWYNVKYSSLKFSIFIFIST